MDITLSYLTESGFAKLDGIDTVVLAPNRERTPVFFKGRVADPLLVRDGLLCLRDVVVSDFDTRLTEAELAMRLDPIATVAEDELSFEAFSQDESCYARLALKDDLIADNDAWQSGTTNVDFTDRLARSVEAIRSSSPTGFVIDPAGFEVRTNIGAVREKKVAVPDAWLRGFANIQSSMCAPLETVTIGKADLRNILSFLRSHVERDGPRALVFRLRAGAPVEVMFEPWGHVLALPGSAYSGAIDGEVRVWGRRRLTLLNRLMPRIQKLTVYVSGSGYPTFWVCDMGRAVFLLALSGWTIQPFTRSALHLAAPREAVGTDKLTAVGNALRTRGRASFDEIVRATNTEPGVSRTALSLLAEQGQAIYDIAGGFYRWRQALAVPLGELASEPDHKRERDADDLVAKGAVTIARDETRLDHAVLGGTVRGAKSDYRVTLTLDPTRRMLDGECECAWFRYNHLHAGPCKHLLALRQAAGRS